MLKKSSGHRTIIMADSSKMVLVWFTHSTSQIQLLQSHAPISSAIFPEPSWRGPGGRFLPDSVTVEDVNHSSSTDSNSKRDL